LKENARRIFKNNHHSLTHHTVHQTYLLNTQSVATSQTSKQEAEAKESNINVTKIENLTLPAIKHCFIYFKRMNNVKNGKR